MRIIWYFDFSTGIDEEWIFPFLPHIASHCSGLKRFCPDGIGDLDKYVEGVMDICKPSITQFRTLSLVVCKASPGTLEM